MLDVAALFAHWSPHPPREITVPERGTQNQTFMVETDVGPRVLRAYRPLARDRIEREHALMAYASARGLPVPCPISMADGSTLLERDGRFFALFSHASGTQVARAALTAAEAAAAGCFLARLHGALAGYAGACPNQDDKLATPPHRSPTLARIEELLRVVRSQAPGGADEEIALRRLEERRRWLIAQPPIDVQRIQGLPAQPLHGDYQEANLFFADGEVSAVIDWEQAVRGPRGWEVTRALDFMLLLDPELSAAFLASYRERLALSDEELDLAAAGYAEMRANDLWVYKAIYLEGNDRVRRFLRPGPFVPFTDRWAALRSG